MTDIIKTLERGDPNNSSLFKSIDIPGFRLSIQADENHHCEPKKTLKNATPYTKFEVALYPEHEKLTNFIRMDIKKQYDKWLDINESTLMLFVYMPYDEVNKLYNTLLQYRSLPKQINKTPIIKLGGITILIELPCENNNVIGELNIEKIEDELIKYTISDSIEIEDINISGIYAITLKDVFTNKYIPLYMEIISDLVKKHYHA